MPTPTILITGYGVVGHNLAAELAALKPLIYDKYKAPYTTYPSVPIDVEFICVDTPLNEKNICDRTEVYDALWRTTAKVAVIKSTVLPGTTAAFRDLFKRRIIFSPEYYGGTPHCNNFQFNYTILGGEKEDCAYVQQVLQNCYDARHSFRITDSTTAELAKYMENAWLATKVSFCTQFAQLAIKFGSHYEDLRELFILDPRVNPSHTYVYDDHPYWSSHCLDKDVPAIAEFGDAELLKAVIKFNENCKKSSK